MQNFSPGLVLYRVRYYGIGPYIDQLDDPFYRVHFVKEILVGHLWVMLTNILCFDKMFVLRANITS